MLDTTAAQPSAFDRIAAAAAGIVRRFTGSGAAPKPASEAAVYEFPVRPLVSVVVPTCNRPARLALALDSILAQTYTELEIVVVNDNVPGTDADVETERVLDGYMADGRVVRLHTEGRIGGGAARNLACRRAGGEYLAFLDDDDTFLPDKIATQLAFTMANGFDMSWQDVSWYDEAGNLVEHRRLDHCTDFSREGLLRAHLMTPISPTSIYLLKKELFDRTEGFGEVPCGQDWWLMLRCIETGARIGYMPGVHVRQLIHSGERLSVGPNKLAGELARHEAVKRYYPGMAPRDVRYIEFRHNAVLAFSSGRGGRMDQAVRYGARAFAASPASCVSQGIKYFTSGKNAS
jgi:hypothetical protein